MKNIALLLATTFALSGCDKDKEDDNEAPVYGSWTVGGTSYKASAVYRSEIGKVLTATDAFGNQVSMRFTFLPVTGRTYSIVQAPDTITEMGIIVTMAGTGYTYYTRGDDQVKATVLLTNTINDNKITVIFPSVWAYRYNWNDSLKISGTIIEL